MGSNKVHTFDNGVKIYDYQILDKQRERYKKRNVHEEDEEDLFIDIIQKLPESALYVNVGSAVGYYPLLAHNLRKDIKIHCFEPLSIHNKMFKENIVLNSFNDNDFHIHNIAVSENNGKVLFRNASYGSKVLGTNKGSILSSIKNILRGNKNQVVKSLTLFKIKDIIQISKVDFLQMDVQGHEEPILRKYFEEVSDDFSISSFLVGTHGVEIHEKCAKIFSDNGYELIINHSVSKNQPDGIIYCKKQ
jgi:FkbM family methyltransferase